MVCHLQRTQFTRWHNINSPCLRTVVCHVQSTESSNQSLTHSHNICPASATCIEPAMKLVAKTTSVPDMRKWHLTSLACSLIPIAVSLPFADAEITSCLKTPSDCSHRSSCRLAGGLISMYLDNAYFYIQIALIMSVSEIEISSLSLQLSKFCVHSWNVWTQLSHL